MLLPMFGFIATLLVVGGLGTLVAISDPRKAHLAAYLGFTALSAGLGALTLSLLFAFIGSQLLISETAAGLGFFGGYLLGALGGGAFGLYLAFHRRSRTQSATHE